MLFAFIPLIPVVFCGGAGGKNPCVGFNGVICGVSDDGSELWCCAWLALERTGVGRVKLADGADSFPDE